VLAATDGIEVLASSSVYRTSPVGELTEQRDFYNAVVRVETSLPPRDLLAACKSSERKLGRPAEGPRHGPRPIDLDVLLIDDLVIADEDFSVPHPSLAERQFVLVPLAELAPELTLPDGRTLDQAIAAADPEQRVERIG
jgi:2-amino-4-hydroxy-6-hydroxymethyldihydropteridine diphosphokinase